LAFIFNLLSIFLIVILFLVFSSYLFELSQQELQAATLPLGGGGGGGSQGGDSLQPTRDVPVGGGQQPRGAQPPLLDDVDG
jgi:hypothetical protein